MRMAFGDLPIGAHFETHAGWINDRPVQCVKVAARRYRQLDSGNTFDKSPGVYVDCTENELRLAVLRVRNGS